MSATAADALLDMIRGAVSEDDMEAVTSLLHRLDAIEPASADIIRRVLFFTGDAA